MSMKRIRKNTDELMADALRRVMPKPKQVHKDRNRYNRKEKHKGNHE